MTSGQKGPARTIREQLMAFLSSPPATISDAARDSTERQLQGPALPPELAHVALWWHELAETRQSTGFGLGRLGYPEVLAWATLTQRQPTPTEVEALLAGDRAFVSEVSATPDAPSTYDPDTALAGPGAEDETDGAG